MDEQKPRSLTERLFEELSEEELSKPVRLEGVDQVFTVRSLLRPRDRKLPSSPALQSDVEVREEKRRQGGTR